MIPLKNPHYNYLKRLLVVQNFSKALKMGFIAFDFSILEKVCESSFSKPFSIYSSYSNQKNETDFQSITIILFIQHNSQK